MDYKPFLYFVLIPVLCLGISYALMGYNRNGKKLYWILSGVLVLANITYVLVIRYLNSLRPPKIDFGAALIHIGIIYASFIAFAFFALFYRVMRKR